MRRRGVESVMQRCDRGVAEVRRGDGGMPTHLLEVDEICHRDREQLIERPEANNRRDVAAIDDKGVFAHGEDSRDRIHREEDVAEGDAHEGRGELGQLAVDDEPVALECV